MKVKIKAYENTIKELNKVIGKKRKKLEKLNKQQVCVIINGDEYYTDFEIREAYGCDIITRAQCDKAIKGLESKQNGVEKLVIDEEIKLLSLMVDSVYQLIEKESDKNC